MKKVTFLGLHGLGDHRHRDWESVWSKAIRASFPSDNPNDLKLRYETYDDIFADTKLSQREVWSAIAKLLGSGIGNILRPRARGRFGDMISNMKHWTRWSPGMVVAWLEDEGFQRKTRRRIYDALKEHKPDVMMAHSLGSLLTYDALSHEEAQDDSKLQAIIAKLYLVTLGSQIGNPFVKGNLSGGYLVPPPVFHWYNLYNPEDAVFVKSINLSGVKNFTQVRTFFDLRGSMDHSAGEYLSNDSTVDFVWKPIAADLATTLTSRKILAKSRLKRAERKARKRAVLFGIDNYPDPADRLEGCVNDAFLVSSVLQECGFDPIDMRMCLNDRATTEGIMERFEWLIDDARSGDELLFFYSGHGAQLPTYGLGDTIDHMDETLVPYDFDWSPENCVTDDMIFEMYSQLDYGTKFVMIFDCCHSGGIHRAGAPKVRGLNPPDDIRHRGLYWDTEESRWRTRSAIPVNPQFGGNQSVRKRFMGEEGCTFRLGRGISARSYSSTRYDRFKKSRPTNHAPFLPVILEACDEHQFSYEYRHGATSYGAFTYNMVSILREYEAITFNQLMDLVTEKLIELQYDQEPQQLGPQSILDEYIPWGR